MQKKEKEIKIMKFDLFCKAFVKIKTKDSKLVPFNFNLFQRRTLNAMRAQQKSLRPMRIIALKPRQVGCTTFGANYCLYSSLTFNRSNSLLAADKDDNSRNLNTIVSTSINNLPRPKPNIEVDTATAIVIGNGNGGGQQSKIEFSTAGSTTLGRSGTYRQVHLSEFAYFENAGRVMTALQSVPKTPETLILIESTANGMSGEGEEFYVRWKEAVSGESGYSPVFCAWWEVAEYSMPLFSKLEKSSRFGDEELLKRTYKVTDEQLNWRRYVILNEMGKTAIDRIIDPVTQFDQEYPHSPSVAFLTSGRPVFDPNKIEKDIAYAKTVPSKRYRITSSGVIRDDSGDLVVYHSPDNSSCTIGADVAEGLEIGDSSSLFVVDKNMRQMASWHGKREPFDFGRDLTVLGRWYKNALLAPERNNHGHAVIAAIKVSDYWNVLKNVVWDETIQKETEKLGWLTTRQSKVMMIDNFLKLWLNDEIKILDVLLLEEMKTVFTNPDGTITINGKDRLAAACIACISMAQNTFEQNKASRHDSLGEETKEDFTKLPLSTKIKKRDWSELE